MRTIRIKLYKFSELTKGAQTNAINQLSDINVDSEYWFNGIYTDAEDIGLRLGGFEFDSASFVRNLTGEFIISANEVAANILKDHGESCETYKTALSFMEVWQPVFSKYMETEEGEDRLIEIEDKFLTCLIIDYKNLLQTEYDYQTTEKSIIETIEANEYEFTKDGKLS